MGVADRRSAMRRPSGVRDADRPTERLLAQLPGEIVELPFGAATNELTMIDRADAGTVVAAIFEPLQAVIEPLGYLALADNSDDSAHPAALPLNADRAGL